MMDSKIIGYRGIANQKKLIISGHAFDRHKVRETHANHGRSRNLRQTIQRFHAKPLKWTSIDIRIEDMECSVRTNKYGYFTCEMEHSLRAPGWYPYELFWKRNNRTFDGEFYLSDEHETGVISDIDDTLLVSHSTRLVRKLVLLLFRNAHTRKPIPFLKGWYGHLRNLHEMESPDDFFYVSNSEWNLYDFLIDFFEINELPKGVFFLRGLKKGLRDLVASGKPNYNHKQSAIEFLLKFYPQKNYILVGDNGQKDMEIYADVVSKYGQRIKGVLIRELSYIRRPKRLNFYKQQIEQNHVPFIVFS
jgi:phosphatidate phosphatase APP1